jgi:hypothetical protein
LAASEPERYAVVGTTADPDTTHAAVRAAVEPLLELVVPR